MSDETDCNISQVKIKAWFIVKYSYKFLHIFLKTYLSKSSVGYQRTLSLPANLKCKIFSTNYTICFHFSIVYYNIIKHFTNIFLGIFQC